jgi:mannosyl-3-phosphoglycerate phosphatase family protein
MGEWRRVLFTDLDGTLLDHHDYQPGPAQAALDRLDRGGVAVVPVTSKTRAELEALAPRLGLRHGWIAESGAEIRWPGNAAVSVLGVAADRVRRGLVAAAAAAGTTVRGFADMSDGELRDRTGLDPDGLRAARRRAWSESFLVLRGDPTALARQLERRGLRMRQGGRFLTATGPHDKGSAVRAVLARHPAESWAVGDAPNDAPMLAAVDHPHQVRRPDGTWAALNVPGVARLDGIGPVGFAQLAELMLT